MNFSLENPDTWLSCDVRTTANSTRCTNDIVNGVGDRNAVPTLSHERSLETALLLHEIRADALRAAGLEDEFFSLSASALKKVGMLEFHNRMFDKLLFDADLDLVQAVSNVPICERLRADIEAAATADYAERFGTAPQHVAAMNIRNASTKGIWQAVMASVDGAQVWYRVEIIDDEFELEYLDGIDIEKDDRYTLITDICSRFRL